MGQPNREDDRNLKLYIVLTDARPNDVAPHDVRLKRLLKAALRAYGFRCEEITPHNPNRKGLGGSGNFRKPNSAINFGANSSET